MIYAVSRAGYTPEVFSFIEQGASVICDILATTDGKALLLDSGFTDSIQGVTIKNFVIPDLSELPNPEVQLPPLPEVDENDMAEAREKRKQWNGCEVRG